MCVKNTSLCRPVTTEDVGKRVLFAREGVNADEGLLVCVHDRGVCVAWDDSKTISTYSSLYESDMVDRVRLVPLFWLEGYPIYKGDPVWSQAHGEWCAVDHVSDDGIVWFTNCNCAHLSDLALTKPKTKRKGWVVIRNSSILQHDYDYQISHYCSHVFSSEVAAIAASAGDIVTCVEWEE